MSHQVDSRRQILRLKCRGIATGGPYMPVLPPPL